MLGIIVLVAAIVLMARMAIMANRSPLLWGINTFVCCVLTASVINLPLINIVIGLGVSYGFFAFRCMTAKR